MILYIIIIFTRAHKQTYKTFSNRTLFPLILSFLLLFFYFDKSSILLLRFFFPLFDQTLPGNLNSSWKSVLLCINERNSISHHVYTSREVCVFEKSILFIQSLIIYVHVTLFPFIPLCNFAIVFCQLFPSIRTKNCNCYNNYNLLK